MAGSASQSDAGMPRALGLIVAWAHDRVIGREGQLPWHIPEDLAHFKRVTMGHAMIMGRKCYASIGRALPGRRSLVLTRQEDFQAPGIEVFHDLSSALEAAYETDACPYVIGGAEIYRLALPYVTRMEITEIDRKIEGDVYFPPFDEAMFEEKRRKRAGDLLFRSLVWAR